MVALNERNLDRLIGELTSADFCLHNRSRSPFGDRSAAEFRASVENLHAMVAWARSWESAVCWLSPTLAVSRYEREAVGLDGERYRWTHIIVNEIRNGRIESACLFDVDDEEAAFAYAEERVQATTSRLLIRNRASECIDVGMAGNSGSRRRRRRGSVRGSVRIRRSATTEGRPDRRPCGNAASRRAHHSAIPPRRVAHPGRSR